MNQVTVMEYCDWQVDYNKQNTTERYGQSFLNHFRYKLPDPDPDLFYEENVMKAHKMIMDRYVME